MKEQLTLEHLAPYLPYNLQVRTQYTGGKINNPRDLTTSTIHSFIRCNGRLTIIPLLHPLSQLAEEIEHKGKKLVPIEWLEDMYDTLDLHKQCGYLLKDERWVNQCDYMLICHLIEWHFDVFGLIEKGLAMPK